MDRTKRNSEIIRLYKEGIQQADIAAAVGVTIGVVAGTIKRNRDGTLGYRNAPTVWTEEKVSILKDIYPLGESYSVMAERLSVSIKAVRTKAGKLGLKRLIRPAVKPKVIIEKAEKPPAQPALRWGKDRMSAAFPEMGSGGVTLMELGRGMCKWPVWGSGENTRFCGDPVEDGSYCNACKPRGLNPNYRPIKPRRNPAPAPKAPSYTGHMFTDFGGA